MKIIYALVALACLILCGIIYEVGTKESGCDEVDKITSVKMCLAGVLSFVFMMLVLVP